MRDPDLTPLDPAYKTVLRIRMAITALPFVVGAIVLETTGIGFPGLFAAPIVVLAVAIVLTFPARRWAARGYDMGADRLRVVRGVLFRSDTVVPFGRVQHLDVEQGPLERAFGIARLVLHTAGTHNASVTLPGLTWDDATAMRETIRAHVKRETM